MHLPWPDEEDITYREDTEIRLYVDRDRGTIDRVVQHVHYEDHYGDDDVSVRNVRTTLTFRDVGDVIVPRPDSLDGPGPLETVWDVIYYA